MEARSTFAASGCENRCSLKASFKKMVIAVPAFSDCWELQVERYINLRAEEPHPGQGNFADGCKYGKQLDGSGSLL